jgi:hypothetical protein
VKIVGVEEVDDGACIKVSYSGKKLVAAWIEREYVQVLDDGRRSCKRARLR